MIQITNKLYVQADTVVFLQETHDFKTWDEVYQGWTLWILGEHEQVQVPEHRVESLIEELGLICFRDASIPTSRNRAYINPAKVTRVTLCPYGSGKTIIYMVTRHSVTANMSILDVVRALNRT